MKRPYYLLIFIIILLSCSNKKAEEIIIVKLAVLGNNPFQIKFQSDTGMLFNIKDTLNFNKIEKEENSKMYDVSFKYIRFTGSTAAVRNLNYLIESLVFDSLGSSKNYFEHFLKEYKEEFKDKKPEDVYKWYDSEEIEIMMNSSTIVSLIHDDFEWRAGGAIGFGSFTGYNFDMINNTLVKFDDIFDKSEIGKLPNILEDCYRNQLEPDDMKKSLKELGWSSNTIIVSKNISIDKSGISFMYQRFEDNPYATGLKIHVLYKKLELFLKKGTVLIKNINFNGK